MNKIIYSKLPKSFSKQVDLLESRGLIVKNRKNVQTILSNISYNRLSAYWYPFLNEPKNDEIFKSNIHFDQIFKIYQFDSELRIVMFYAIEQIEIALRTQLIFHLSHKFNSGFWFENKDAFKSYLFYIELLKKLSVHTKDSNHEFIKKYSRKYEQYIPPCWKSFETLSFNTLFSIYKNLKDKEEKIVIAKHFGLHHEVFKSWIHTIIYLRNICAHHSRLWNIVLIISPVWSKSPHYEWVQTWENQNQPTKDKELNMYAAICITSYLTNRVNPYNKFKDKIKELLSRFPDINTRGLGFPNNWESESLWK
ncbi:Abi family protein [Aquimarina sp. ERC-38]|uniref:Abi family protein n=1 Tax=Aquimarina sp. ERC-38 TaxID=2949996 RepID=UPI0022466962|nr:Abi family protein [Aquimarina sp. ERC-38]UZO81978.1 Abi family protein [Aquimarina sp. ERC-38]